MRGFRRWMLLTGCLAASAPTADGAALEITVRHTFQGEPLLLDSLRYRNAAGETLSVTRLSYLLSGFALERAEGGWVELPGQFAWIDATQSRTGWRLAPAPEGKYRALRFSIGPDAETNAGDPARWPAGHPMTKYEPRTGQRGADCFHCHGGPLFSDHQFHNNGLAPDGSDQGLFWVTGREGDRGKFATPGLRNVARRGLYMHDGRFPSWRKSSPTTITAFAAPRPWTRTSPSIRRPACDSVPKTSGRWWRF